MPSFRLSNVFPFCHIGRTGTEFHRLRLSSLSQQILNHSAIIKSLQPITLIHLIMLPENSPWCERQDSNLRHIVPYLYFAVRVTQVALFFTIALPTELLSHNKRLLVAVCATCTHTNREPLTTRISVMGFPWKWPALCNKNFSKFTTFNFSVLNQTHRLISRSIHVITPLLFLFDFVT